MRFAVIFRPRVFIALLLILATGISGLLLLDVVPKEIATRTTMWVVKRRILLHAQENDRLPSHLAEIPLLPRFNNSINDAWGRPLVFRINNNKTVTLLSFGKDGLPGGEGANADIILSFPTHDEKGRWSSPLVDWLKESSL